MARVLVADDSLSVRKVVERCLGTKGIEVLSVGSGSEAIERIERDEPDLVVCDVIMPDRDGFEICHYVRNHPRLSKTPVLLISGVLDSHVMERAARARPDDVMRKPFAADELLRKVTALLPPGSLDPAGSTAHDQRQAAAAPPGPPAPAVPPFRQAPSSPGLPQPTPPSISASPAAPTQSAVLVSPAAPPPAPPAPPEGAPPVFSSPPRAPAPPPFRPAASFSGPIHPPPAPPSLASIEPTPPAPPLAPPASSGPTPPAPAPPPLPGPPPSIATAGPAPPSISPLPPVPTPPAGWSSPASPAPPPALIEPTPPPPAPPPLTRDLKGALGQFAAMAGVRLVVLVDKEGFVIESAGGGVATGEITGALTSALRGGFDGLCHELGQGALQGMILEYERGMVLLHALGSGATLAVVLGDSTMLGKVRYYVKRTIPELLRAI